MQERIAAQPGVESVAQVFLSPFGGGGWNDTVHGEGSGASTGGKLSWFNRVGPGYFRTLKTAVLAGRDFGRGDTAERARGGHRQRGVRPDLLRRAATPWGARSASRPAPANRNRCIRSSAS